MKKYLLVILAFLVVVYLYHLHLDYDSIITFIEEEARSSPLLFVGIYTLALVGMLPILPLTIAGSAIYGAVPGALYNSLACTLGLIISYCLSRSELGALIYKKFNNYEVFREVRRGVGKNLIKIVITTRCVPVFSYGVQNYIYGILNVKFLPYFIVSTIATLIMNLVYTTGISRVLRDRSLEHSLIYLVLFLFSVKILKYFWERSKIF